MCLRMMKLRQKISGGFVSTKGTDDFAVVRGIIATARKQGRDIIESVMSQTDRLIVAIGCV